jgi:hypothetical protein
MADMKAKRSMGSAVIKNPAPCIYQVLRLWQDDKEGGRVVQDGSSRTTIVFRLSDAQWRSVHDRDGRVTWRKPNLEVSGFDFQLLLFDMSVPTKLHVGADGTLSRAPVCCPAPVEVKVYTRGFETNVGYVEAVFMNKDFPVTSTFGDCPLVIVGVCTNVLLKEPHDRIVTTPFNVFSKQPAPNMQCRRARIEKPAKSGTCKKQRVHEGTPAPVKAKCEQGVGEVAVVASAALQNDVKLESSASVIGELSDGGDIEFHLLGMITPFQDYAALRRISSAPGWESDCIA